MLYFYAFTFSQKEIKLMKFYMLPVIDQILRSITSLTKDIAEFCESDTKPLFAHLVHNQIRDVL